LHPTTATHSAINIQGPIDSPAGALFILTSV